MEGRREAFSAFFELPSDSVSTSFRPLVGTCGARKQVLELNSSSSI